MPNRIVCFGDVIDDVVAIPSGPLRHDTDTPAAIRFHPGGSAANTAAWLGSVGAAVDLVGVVGDADVERHTAALLGVDVHLRGHSKLPTGTIVVVVDGEARTMLTERGANAALDPADVTPALLVEAAVLHLTGHTLLNDAGANPIAALIAAARAAGVAVSVSPGSVGFIEDYGVREFRAAIAGASILFPSLAEGRLLTGLVDAREVSAALAQEFELVVMTLGGDGVLVDGVLVPAVSATVVDPTGAGDAFCAGFLDEWVRSRDAVAAARSGVALAARAVGTSGGRPR